MHRKLHKLTCKLPILQQSTTSASSTQIGVGAFAPPCKRSHSTLTRSHSDIALSRPAAKPLSAHVHHPKGGKQGKITGIFGPQTSAVLGTCTTQRTSPPIAYVAPVRSKRETFTGARLVLMWVYHLYVLGERYCECPADPTCYSTEDVEERTSHPSLCSTEDVQKHTSIQTGQSKFMQ